MTLNAPSQMIFIIAVVIAILALLCFFVPAIPVIGGITYAFWILVLAFVILAGACLMRGA